MTMMHAFLLRQPGPPESLEWGETPLPEPGPGEVRVRVAAVSVNPVDYYLVESGHPAWTYPHAPGVDGAGVVDAVGDGVGQLAVGDRVAFHADLRRGGSFAEHLVIVAHAVARVPDAVSLEVAAALPCAAMTAYQSLARRMRVGVGDWVLVNGASGGVGGYAVQLARRAGGRVIGTASPRNHAYLRAIGAEAALDYNDPDLVAKAREISGGVNALIETAGAATALLDALAYGGGIACILGLPDLEKYRRHPMKPSLHPIALGAAYPAGDRHGQEDLARMLEELLALVASGELDPLVAEVRERPALPRTLADLKAGGVRGKLVVRMSED